MSDESGRTIGEKILDYVYEYGLYALLGVSIGLVAHMIIKAFLR